MAKMAREQFGASHLVSSEDLRLCREAVEAAQRAYAPYSKFAVGAAIRTVDGKTFAGANLENAVYGLSICAEMAALANLNFNDDPGEIDAVAVAGYSLNQDVFSDQVVTPCGRCRQLISEFASRAHRNVPVFCCKADLSQIDVYRIEELLPYAFGPRTLGKGA